jgi:hypothetical protein
VDRATASPNRQVPGLPTVPQRRLAPHRPPRQRGQQHQARSARTGAVTAPRVRRSSAPAYRPPRHLGDRPLHACQNRPRHQARHTPSPLARGRDTDLRSALRRSAQNAATEHRRPGRRHRAQIGASERTSVPERRRRGSLRGAPDRRIWAHRRVKPSLPTCGSVNDQLNRPRWTASH